MRKYILAALVMLASLFSAQITNIKWGSRPATNGGYLTPLPLAELEADRIWVLDPGGFDSNASLRPDLTAVVRSLIDVSNMAAMETLSAKWNLPPFVLSNLSDRRLELLRRLDTTNSGVWSSTPIPVEKKTGDVVLKSADLVQSWEITTNGKKERMVEILGKVSVLVQQSEIRANRLVLNLTTRDLFAEGDLEIRTPEITAYGTRALLNVNDKGGWLDNVKGSINQNIYFSSSLMKINNDRHVSLDNLKATYSTNPAPHYYFAATHLDYQKEKRIIAEGMRFYVHDHPFFALPFFIQEPFGTGIVMKSGKSDREGWYTLNTYKFNTPRIGKINTSFDWWQKLGGHIDLKNEISARSSRFASQLAFARTWDNAFLKAQSLDFNNNLVYSSYTNNLSRDMKNRYKINLKWDLDLAALAGQAQSASRNLLQIQWNKASDPYFSHDTERPLERINFMALILDNQKPEGQWLPSPSDSEYLKINLSQSFGSSGSLGILADWEYINQNRYSADETSQQGWESVLRKRTLPSITYSQSGTLDPKAATNEAGRRHLHLNYNAAMNFTATEWYSNIYPNGFERDDNNFRLTGGFSRAFSYTERNGKSLRFMDASLSTGVSMAYQRKWGGEELPTYNPSVNLRETYLQFSSGESLSFNFPSAKVKGEISSAYGKKSLLPTASLNFGYNITSQNDKADDGVIGKNTTNGILGKITGQSARSSFNIQQNGWGLFFIKGLDYAINAGTSISYDLMPKFISNDLTRRIKWHTIDNPYRTEYLKSNVNSFDWSAGGVLKYGTHFTLDEKYRVLLFEKTSNDFVYKPQANSMTLSWGWTTKHPSNNYRIDVFNLSYNWNYNFQKERYLGDSMSFSLSTVVTLAKNWKISFTTSSAARNAVNYSYKKLKELYGTEYADKYHRSFFDDLIMSLQPDSDKRKNGYFKLRGMNFSVYHDLEDWFLQVTYAVTPMPYSYYSLRGYYFDRKFSFEINLKPEIQQKVASSAATANDGGTKDFSGSEDFKLDPYERDYTSPAFKK